MERKLRQLAVAAAIAATLAAGAGSAQGGETDRGGLDVTFSTRTAGAPTALGLHVLYKNPDDPNAKPPPITGAVFELAPGLRIDDTAVPRCLATDDELRARGRDACPAESRVGDGKLIAITGVPGADPATTDVVAFNGDGEIVEVVFFEGTNVVAGMDRLTIDGSTLVAHPPATPGGPPDGRTAVREIRLELPLRIGAGGRAYVTAPATCATGTWLSRASYEFADGGTTTVTSESPCTPRPAKRKRARRGHGTRLRSKHRHRGRAAQR
jgi:hypothetical protein